MRLIPILIVLVAGALPTAAQPTYEMRAVWLTTALGLDWPAGETDPAVQEASLRSIIRASANQNLNTVFFQAVPRGDAFFVSDRLPWSPVLTGTPGQDPGFDPLAVAVEEAHRNGLELHVWFNVYRIQQMTTSGNGPRHVTETNPEWTEKSGGWLNPGHPGVTDWLVANVMEIVSRYDIDGVHFDFARYDDGGYVRDDSLFAVNNPSEITDKNDWRRNNVTLFMRDASTAVLAEKPWIKLGSAPIGNYDESCFDGAFTGYGRVFQESRVWLQEGYNDYLAPQFYWADSNPNTPSFTCLVNDWVTKKGTSRHIYAGAGLYVADVKAEIGSQIDVSRNDGADGIAFFREEHTKGEDFDGRFDLPALRPPAAWRFESRSPTVPTEVRLTVNPNQPAVYLSWHTSRGGDSDPVGWYLVLRTADGRPDPMNTNHHRGLVFADRTEFADPLEPGDAGPYNYSVMAISRLGSESFASTPVSTGVIPTSASLPEIPGVGVSPVYPNPAQGPVTITLDGISGPVSVTVVDQSGRTVWSEQIPNPAGPVVIDTENLASGVYSVEVVTETGRAARSFAVAK